MCLACIYGKHEVCNEDTCCCICNEKIGADELQRLTQAVNDWKSGKTDALGNPR